MKKEITLTLIAIFLISFINFIAFVSASGFSPTSLIYTLAPNQEQCQQITITSDSQLITIEDKWAENKDIEWKVSNFNNSASEHDISITYPDELTTQRQFDVCLSGSEPGEYHGVILMKEQQVGNSIIQMGVWLKVTISGEVSQETQSQTTETSSSASASPTFKKLNQTPEEQTPTPEIETKTEEKQSSLITGGVIGFIGENSIVSSIIFVIIIFIALLIISRNKIIEYISWKTQIWRNN